MLKSKTLISVITSIALAVGSTVALSDPGNGKGQGQGQGQGNGKKSHSQSAQDHGNPGNGAKVKSSNYDDWDDHPSIDHGDVLRVLNRYHNYWIPGAALPPGVQKNLARGKPLPPGIAKKLDGRLVSQLPYYEGYEWQQAGRDLILVAIATGIIYEVLNGALD